MRVELKGVHTTTKVLADGRKVRYFYAWRGGPRLDGKPGDPAFIASYKAAVEARRQNLQPKKVLQFLVDSYRDSPEFRKLAVRTQADYKAILLLITGRFGDFPIKLLADRRCRADFLGWRDELAKRSPRQADYAWTVLARVLSWSVERGHIDTNPAARGGKLYDGNRAEMVWKPEDEAAFLAKASGPIRLAMTMALWTGQRQGDLLKLDWLAYDGECLRLRQSKTGIRVTIPAGAPLKSLLDAARVGAPAETRILLNSAGEPWTPDGFRASWGKTCRRAGIKGLTFHDLRGTAVTHLFAAGCSEAEVATITGHSLHDVQSILDANYFSRDIALARSGIAKLERSRVQNPGLQTPPNPLIDQG